MRKFDIVPPVDLRQDGTVLEVFLVDDGCTDGTLGAVKEHFPAVRCIEGDGNLFWCGGMRLAWAEAAKADFDGYVWLNDDTILRPGALRALIAAIRALPGRKSPGQGWVIAPDGELPAAVVVGAMCDPATGVPTYGERGPHGVMPPPVETPREAAWSINGNLVLVSRAAFRVLGNLSDVYLHSFGDVDYGIRARCAGVPVVVAPGFLGECRSNGPPKWQQAGVPLAKRWRALRGPKGISARQLRHFMRLQGSSLWWLAMLRLYATALAPSWFARARTST